MGKEFETHILNINREETVKKLEALGAVKVKDVLQKRITFDFPDRRMDQQRAWVRLRDTGEGKVQLAYKCHRPEGAGGVADCDEVEFDVPEMDRVEQFLVLIGLERKSYQETKRLSYRLDDLEFDIDEWPMLEPFIEVEGPSKERVMEGVRLLGYDEADTFQGHAGDMYELRGIDWKVMKEIKFKQS